MRALALGLLIAAAGCASNPQPTINAATAAATGTAQAPTDQEKTDQVDAIRFAIDNGYQIKNQNGQELYCREDAKTGTRIKSTLTCLTLPELKQMHDRFEQDLADMRRKGYGTGPGGGGG